jgi:uncharacterized protein (TIGR02284 family)
MAVQTEHSVLSHLIETCRDGARGFHLAAEQVASPTLKTVFTELADQRTAFADELLPHVYRLGGEAPANGTRAAALHRGWMDVKQAVVHTDQAVLTEVRRGNTVAVQAYTDAVNSLLPPDTRDLVQRQCDLIVKSHASLMFSEAKG